MAGSTLAGRGGSGPYVRPLDDGGGGLPAYAAATSFTVSTETPFSDSGPVPCANGGAGEQVDLSGSLHELFHVTVDDSGAVHVTSHDNPQGINGVGETTGAARASANRRTAD